MEGRKLGLEVLGRSFSHLLVDDDDCEVFFGHSFVRGSYFGLRSFSDYYVICRGNPFSIGHILSIFLLLFL